MLISPCLYLWACKAWDIWVTEWMTGKMRQFSLVHSLNKYLSNLGVPWIVLDAGCTMVCKTETILSPGSLPSNSHSNQSGTIICICAVQEEYREPRDSPTGRISIIIFWLQHVVCGILVPRPGIEPRPSAVKARSSDRWTATEFPVHCF